MAAKVSGKRSFGRRHAATGVAVAAAAVAALAAPAAQAGPIFNPKVLVPGSVVVSGSVYDAPSSILTAGQTVLPGCVATPTAPLAKSCKPTMGKAISDGTYPYVFNNDTVDGSFGVTSPAYLYDINRDAGAIRTIPIPTSDFVTSFSSKSEMALNFSTSGGDLTLMGYAAPDATLDVSNSNTPTVIDDTNPVQSAYDRAVADLGSTGGFNFTETNAYSGNNGRAAILNAADNVLYTAGNAGNGGNPQPNGVILGAGAQILSPQVKSLVAQTPGDPTPVGSFNVTQLGLAADKVGKDTNFRGLTVFNNVVYLTKGSGGNGVNTVYFIDTTGNACPGTGVGVPQPNAPLPTAPIAYNPALLQTEGVTPYNMCILKGFPTNLANGKPKGSPAVRFPFGIWFANATTLYVADEGNGDNTYSGGTYTGAAAQTTAGLQKWTFDNQTGTWNYDYTLQSGLDLGTPYTPSGSSPTFPAGNNAATGLPWAPGTDGLRNITGKVNGDGTATIWGITSTVSGSGDQGADPNKLVSITDNLSATSLPSESFTTIDSANSGEVLRGVSFTPGTTPSQ
jgi:hypothetical protein